MSSNADVVAPVGVGDGALGARSDTVEDRVNAITGFLNVQHAELVDVVVELSADRSAWQGEGVWTMSQWLAWRCGVSSSTAKQIVDVANRADDLPVAMSAFRSGRLTLDQMSTLARRAPWWVDSQITTLATMMTVSQIRRTLREYPFPNLDEHGREIRADDAAGARELGVAADEDQAVTERPMIAATRDHGSTSGESSSVDEWCSFSFGDDGVFRLRLETGFDAGHVIESALVEARDRLFQDGHLDVDWVDAVREVAERSLDSIPDAARRSRFRINLHLDVDAGLGAGTAAMSDAAGWTVPDAIRRHLTCDGMLSPTFVSAGKPVSVGRSQRVVPERTRAIVERRDHHTCRVPGCTATNWLEIHHIVHWEHGGPTDTWNLVALCARHHRQHHRGVLSIIGNADLTDGEPGSLEFHDQRGRRLTPCGATPTMPIGPPPSPAAVYEHPLGQRIQPDCLYFQPPPAHQQEINERIARDLEVFRTHPDLR